MNITAERHRNHTDAFVAISNVALLGMWGATGPRKLHEMPRAAPTLSCVVSVCSTDVREASQIIMSMI